MINWTEIFKIESLIGSVFGGIATFVIIFLIARISKRTSKWIRTKFTKLDQEIFVRAAKKETWRAIYEINATAIITLAIILLGIYLNFNKEVKNVEYALEAEYSSQEEKGTAEVTEASARTILFMGKTLATSLHVGILIFLLVMMWRIYAVYNSNYLLTEFNWKLTRVKPISSHKFIQETEIKWAEMKSRSDYVEIMKTLDCRLKASNDQDSNQTSAPKGEEKVG